MTTDSTEKQSKNKETDLVGIKAAVDRANSLTLVSLLQDAIARVGAVLVFIVYDSVSWYRPVAALLTLGVVWMLSKASLKRVISSIERDYLPDATRSDEKVQMTEWVRLSVAIGSHRSATRFRIWSDRILALEPLILTVILSAFVVGLSIFAIKQ